MKGFNFALPDIDFENLARKLKNNIQRNKWLSAFLLIFLIITSYITIIDYYSFDYHVLDYGIEHQVLYNTAHGRWMQSSYEADSYLGDHFSPIVTLFAPIYRLLPLPFLPTILQNISFILFLLAIYKIAYGRLKSKFFSFFLVLAFSVYPYVTGSIMFHYHPVVLGMPFFIWGLYFMLEKNRYNLGLILLIIASLAKEEVGFSVGMVGLYDFITNKRYKSLGLFLYGFFISFFSMAYIIPFFRGSKPDSLGRYGHLGGSFGEIALSPFKKPKEWVKMFVDLERVGYLRNLFKVFLFTPLFSLAIIIPLPLIAITFISQYGAMRSTSFHYGAILTCGIAYSCILGMEKLLNLMNAYFGDQIKTLEIKNLVKKVSVASVVFLILIMGYLGIFFDNTILKRFIKSLPPQDFTTLQELEEIKEDIPKSAWVGVDGKSGAYFHDFENTRLFPSWDKDRFVTVDNVDYIVIYKNDSRRKESQDFIKTNQEYLEIYIQTENFTVYTTNF